MAFSVNTNGSALFALQALNKTNRQLDTTQSRINSGLKVANAKDNAAIFAIAQGQRAELTGLGAVKGSLDRASSAVNVTLAAAEAVSDLLNQLKEKATSAADPGSDAASRKSYNDEFKSLIDQINTVVNSAEFNGVNAVKNGGSNIAALIALPDGSNSAKEYSLTVVSADLSASAGLDLTKSLVITSASGASSALGVIEDAQSTIESFLSQVGAAGKRIDIQNDFITKLSDSIEVGIGNLVDADLARESANLQSLQVRQQLGLQALSIANQRPGSVLSLFR